MRWNVVVMVGVMALGVTVAEAGSERWKSLEAKAMRQLSRMEIDNAARSILAAVDSVKTPGEDHIGLVSTLAAVGATLGQSGKLDRGCRLLERAIALEEQIDGEGALGAGANLITLAALEMKAKRPKRARAAAARGVKSIRTMGRNSPELVEPLAVLALAMQAQGEGPSGHAVLAKEYPVQWPKVATILAREGRAAGTGSGGAPGRSGPGPGISVAEAERRYQDLVRKAKSMPGFAKWARQKQRSVGKMSRGELLRLEDELVERDKALQEAVDASQALESLQVQGPKADVEKLHERWGKRLARALRGILPAMNASMELADAIADELLTKRR
jgi:hypothetical protein